MNKTGEISVVNKMALESCRVLDGAMLSPTLRVQVRCSCGHSVVSQSGSHGCSQSSVHCLVRDPVSRSIVHFLLFLVMVQILISISGTYGMG